MLNISFSNLTKQYESFFKNQQENIFNNLKAL